MKPSLGDFIRQRRSALGLTQRQVAIELGFKSIAHLSDIEGGNRNPAPEVLPRLAAVLQVSLEELQNHDARLPVQEIKDLLEKRPELVAAFRRVAKTAETLAPEEIIRRVEGAPKPPPASPPSSPSEF
jgi:transcriptional regulator with XRE-family HTH domain